MLYDIRVIDGDFSGGHQFILGRCHSITWPGGSVNDDWGGRTKLKIRVSTSSSSLTTTSAAEHWVTGSTELSAAERLRNKELDSWE